jgi:hypothetical protein
MRTVETVVYQYDELSPEAQENARDWFLKDFEFETDFVLEDAARVAALLGVEFDTHTVDLYGGGTRQKPNIYWSGFSSQGDGACFEGSYAYAPGSVKAVKAYAPEDKELHGIAQQLQEAQKRQFYSLVAQCKHRGHYYHSGCMDVVVEDSREIDVSAEAEDAVTEALRSFADWVYDQLQAEYEYQTSDEAVEESIKANEYEFTADGGIAW